MRINYSVPESIKLMRELVLDGLQDKELSSIFVNNSDGMTKEKVTFLVSQIRRKGTIGKIEVAAGFWKNIKSFSKTELFGIDTTDDFFKVFSDDASKNKIDRNAFNYLVDGLRNGTVSEEKTESTTSSVGNKYASSFKPKELFVHPDGENQRSVGYPNGCTQFSCQFLQLSKGTKPSQGLLAEIIDSADDLNIQKGRNEMPRNIVGDFNNLVPVYDDPMPWVFFKKTLMQQVKEFFDGKIKGDACLITTGIETFAIRKRGKVVDFFDPHGNAKQSQPAFIMTVNNDYNGAKTITNLINGRAALVIEETGQLDVFPVTYTETNSRMKF